MKQRKRKGTDVPQNIRSFIDNVIAAPLEQIELPLKDFVWEFGKGDLNHWIGLFARFDSFFNKYIRLDEESTLEEYISRSFPREAVLQILRVSRIILENCSNRHIYSSFMHFASLLSSTDDDVIESTLQTLMALTNKSGGCKSPVIRIAHLSSKLFSLAQGWGSKEGGLGLIACCIPNPETDTNGSTLHFEFYSALNGSNGLRVIHVPDTHLFKGTDHELFAKLVEEYSVPVANKFALLTRLRFARAFESLERRYQFVCIRLYAFILLVQSGRESEDITAFFANEPEFIDELLSLLSYDEIPEKVRILGILSLAALCQDRSHQPTLLASITSGGHRTILPTILQKSIDSVLSTTCSTKWSTIFTEVLFSLLSVLVSSTQGSLALQDAGIIPALLPLLKNIDPQNLQLVTTSLSVIEGLLDYHPPSSSLFRDLGGLDESISRLQAEVLAVESTATSSTVRGSSSRKGKEVETVQVQPLYFDTLVSNDRKALIMSLLRVISLATFAPGSTARVDGSQENLLPQCLCAIFKKGKDFGGGVFSLAAQVITDLIHKDPTCFPALESAGLPGAFIDAIANGSGPLCSSDVVTCIPPCLDALCLNNNGLNLVKERNALKCFVKIFTSKSYLKMLTSETTALVSSGLDELLRHASSLRPFGVEMVIEILDTIAKIGPGSGSGSGSESHSTVSPMETDESEKNLDQNNDVESFVQRCISNVVRLLEPIVQNLDTCRMFVEKKGVDAVLRLFDLHSVPLSPYQVHSMGVTLSGAFKNFSPTQSVSMVRIVRVFLQDKIIATNKVLDSVCEYRLLKLDPCKVEEVLRSLSSLEGLLHLGFFIVKNNAVMMAELAVSENEVLKNLAKVYAEVAWQATLIEDSVSEETKLPDTIAEEADTSTSTGTSRDDDMVSSTPTERESEVASQAIERFPDSTTRSHSAGMGMGTSVDQDFASVVRTATNVHRQGRLSSMTRLRGSESRLIRHLDALHSTHSDLEGSLSALESTMSALTGAKKVPHSLVSEVQQMLNKLRATIISFLNMIVKCLPGRRRTETTLGQYSRSVLNALSQFFLSALNYDGYYSSYTVKCRYLGKVSEDMQALTFDAKRRACYSTTVNGFYVNGTLKQLLTTFEATTQLLWTIPFSSIDDKSPKFPSWLLETMQNYFKLLEYFVNSSYLLSPSAPQSAQLLVQPVSSDLSINLFPVPREPKGLVRLLHTQVLEAVLPIWKSPMLPSCPQSIISPLTTIIEHICSEIGDVKNNTHGEDQLRSANRIIPQISEATATAIVDMGFSRARAEEALRNVGSNSVELATDWLFSHPEEAVQDDVQFAQALALSLGTNNNSNTDSEEGKEDSSAEAANNVAAPVLPLDVILSVVGRLFQKNDDLVVHSLSDLLVTLCNRNKGEDGNMVVCFLIEKLKKCPVGPGTDTGELCSIVHTLALLLTGVPVTREIASANAVVSTVLGILDLVCSAPRKGDDSSDKTMSSLLFILNNMLQGKTVISFPDRNSIKEREKEGVTVEEFFGTILGKTCGYLTEEESQRALTIVCELIKQSVPGSVMQPCFQLCARLTKIHSFSTRFIETGGLSALLSLPTSSVFSGFDTMTSVIVRHLIEDPQTLQSAFELEMKQALNGSSLISRHGARVSVRTFLTTLAPLISRDPVIFMKAATSVCRLDPSSGGRMYMGLLKDNKEKDKDNKNESTPAGRCTRVQKRVPASLSLVMDRLLEIVLSYEPEIAESSDKDKSLAVAMEIDEASNTKGKSKVDEVSEKPSGARVSLVLKLLSEIMLWYSHAVLVLLKRDTEMMQSRGTFGIVHHVLHNLLPSSNNKGCESITGNDTSGHITERAALFLVMLCNHKGEGRRRIVSEIIRAFSSFLGSSNSTSAGSSSSSSANSNGGAMVPDTKAWSLCYLVSLILSRHGGSSNSMPGLGCSPEIARAMIDGGMIESLSSLLKVIDLDHPEAPKVCNLVLKSLESLTRAANSSEHVVKPDDSMKNRTTGSAFLTIEPDSAGTEMASNEEQGVERDQQIEIQEQDRISEEDTGMDRGEEDENPREDSGLGLVRDEDLRDDDDEDEEERDEDDDDEDNDDDDDQEDAVTVIGEDHGAHMIPLAGTNLMDDDDDDFNEEQVEEEEEEEDAAPVNRFIEVTWQGGGLDNLRVSRGRGFIEIASESVGGVDQTEELFNLHRSLRNERRRQTGNSSSTTQWTVDRSGNLTGFRQPLIDRSDHRSGNLTGFRQPLNDRSDRSGNLTGFWQPLNDRSSTPLHIPSREGAVNPIARHYLDGNRIPNEGSASLFREDQLVTSNPPSQFLDFSLGMESLRFGGRSRSAWVSRWTDDGQPQTTLSASSIAQAVEDYFISEIPAVPLQTASNPNPIPEGLPNTASTTPPLINADVEMQPSSSPPPVAAGFVEEGSPPPVEAGIIEEGSVHVLPDSEQVMGEHSNRDAPMSDMDSCHAVISSNLPAAELSDAHDVDTTGMGTNSTENEAGTDVVEEAEPESENLVVVEEGEPEPEPEAGEDAENAENEIDPTFLEALPEDLRAEVLASQQNRQSGGGSGGQDEEVAAASGADVASEEIDPEFLAALPPDIQAEVLAQQRAQRLAQARAQAQPAGQPVDMDNASIIATFPPEIREEVLLTSSEAVLSGLPSNLLAEAQLLRDRELSRYRSRGSLFGGAHHHHHHHRLGTGSRRFTIDGHHQSVMDRGVGASLVRRAVPTLTSSDGSKGKDRDIEGAPLFDKGSLEAIVRLFQLAPPLSKGILQRLMFNMCANCVTRKMLVGLMVDMIRPEADGPGASRNFGQCRLYGSKTNVVYAQPQSSSGLPPLVTRRILENLTYLASSHTSVADILSLSEPLDSVEKDVVEGKGKDVISQCSNTPLLLFLKLLKAPLFLRSRVHLEQVMMLLEVVVNNAVLKIDILSLSDIPSDTPSDPIQALATAALGGLDPNFSLESPEPIRPEPVSAKSSHNIYAVLTALPESELGNLCYILSIEGLPSKVYSLASEVIKKLASTAMVRRKFFSSELATLAQTLSSSAISELSNLRTNQTLGINSVAGTAILRVLQALCTLSPESEPNPVLFDLNSSLEQLWQELSECISLTESKIGQSQTLTSGGEPGAGTVSQPLPPGAQRLLPFIESFFVLCEKLQTNPSMFQLENQNSAPSPQRENLVSFARVAEKHKRLLNVFIRQNPSLLQKSLSMMLKVPRLIEFDNKRSYFRSRMRLHNDNQLSGSIRISVRRAYILEDSYNQLRLRRYQDLKGRLTVQFQGEEGIDAGGLTREWYQSLSRVIFDKGALLFTTVGNNASFQPNPNSVYQTEHLSYFKFVGRVVAKALFDGQLLDVHFTRSFYKHMLGVKVTYHDIEAVDPDYYKNLKWMLENDISDIPDMTFSMDADEEKHILYEKNDVTDYELKPGGRNLRVTEETKHEYVDLVADHILTNAIRPQINAFLEGFTELIPRDLISIFNDKELELLISGLPEIDLDDLRANAEYIGYTAASPVIQWFWEVVKGFSKEDMARLLQFVTGTSKVPLEGFKALQGISGAQRFQIHKAYGAPERLPSAHTCFNQLDLPEYNTKEQLEERLLLAIHEASEGFGFG